MIRNYLKIAWRNLMRNKAYSGLNIAGLAVGIGACLLIFTIVTYELSYNKFLSNYSHIYRVVTETRKADESGSTPGVPTPFARALRTDMPQIKEVTNINMTFGSQFTVLDNNANSSDKKFKEEGGVVFADEHFFKVFDAKFLEGNGNILAQPNTIILDKTTATKYFGDWKLATGKLLKMDNLITLKVSAVIEDFPENSDFPFKAFVSFETAKAYGRNYTYFEDWNSTSSDNQVFVLLPDNISPQSINSLMPKFRNKYQTVDKKTQVKTYLQPISDLHYNSKFGSTGDHNTSKTILWTLSLIGVLILVMASINFINLSTAQAVNRSKEVGVRKVLGSSRRQLIYQLLGETFLIVSASVIIAFIAAYLSLPYLSSVASIPKDVALFTPETIAFALLLVVLITLFSGIYPALIMSGFKPAVALKSRISSANVGGISMRRILVVTQFAISQVLLIATIIAVSQMNYVRNADLGFNKDAVYVVPASTDSISSSKVDFIKQQLLKIPSVQSVSFSSDVPSSDNNWSSNFYFDHSDKDYGFNAYMKFADADFLKTYGLHLLAGRNIEPSDTSREVLINETMLHKLGYTDASKIIGKDFRLGTQIWQPIVGVVNDFKTNSLREDIKPTYISSVKNYYYTIGIKLKLDNTASTIKLIQNIWEKAYPDYVYQGNFLDEQIAEFYKQETQMELVYKIFAAIAIFISCLGLYGLVSFMAIQKTKEVGIRKVLGASISSILYLFSKEFTILISIAFVIAIPAALFIMNNWLQNFVYRISIGAGVFILAIITTLLIAWVTVGYKALRAATANPIKSLRTE